MNLIKYTLTAALAVCACATAAVAGEVYARTLATMGTTGTNTTWTVGKYERPTVVRVDVVGITASATSEVYVAYGDSAGSGRSICTITNDASGNGTVYLGSSPVYLQASDILYIGRRAGATNGATRVHYIQRDTRTAN